MRRRRECMKCTKRFTTYERVEEQIKLMVVKRDGRRVPWDRNKILVGLERASFKRAVPESDLVRIADEVEEEIYRNHEREVPSQAIGQAVIERLRRIDQVAYVRFASVYHQFGTLEEMIEEARRVIAARRYEAPGQGRLFGDDQRAAASGRADAKAASGTKPGRADAKRSATG